MGQRFEEFKPALAMIGLQFSYAGVALLTRAALLKGMSPHVFVFYRQVASSSHPRYGSRSICIITKTKDEVEHWKLDDGVEKPLLNIPGISDWSHYESKCIL